MSKVKLIRAKQLIQEKRYSEAKELLRDVEDPTAQKWLTQLNNKKSDATANTTPTVKKNYQTKILTQKDKWFSGKFDPQSIEQALNAYGQQGWCVVTSSSAEFPGFFAREELIIIMERYDNAPKMEYKVLTQKDKWFSGKFDPLTLENAINAYANQGWRVKQAVTASIPALGGNRDEIIVILERQI